MYKDLTNKRFGKLLVIKKLPSGKDGKVKWLCKCDCGNSSVTKTNYLNSGQTKSCGCIKKSVLGKRSKTHGMSKTRQYMIWINMLARCNRKTSTYYKNYGGRGIKVCKRWLSFENFWEDIGSSYKQGLSLDRIDNNGNYKPSNCKWSDRFEQMNNTRRSTSITYNGITKTIPEWAREIKISDKTLRHRLIDYGWSVKKSLTTNAD